ncbi:Tigger transposable element-derived protein 6-like [Homarus americanus]|uniref:Tigger transposable element-derived protein 6-like n=1 Tax=Homarus americanus TaxID=6706 RepID=A0A8J5MTD5_HOMAM|nr:Tigger transposable element-derived protein 6-like [Homarus americanus]
METALPPHVIPGLSPSDDGAGTSHAADYNTGYGTYTKNEGDQQHLPSDGTDSSGQRMTVTPELLGLMPSNATSHYSSVPGVEKALVMWLKDANIRGSPVINQDLRQEALRLARRLNVEGFCASHGWLHRFKNRNGIILNKQESGGPLMEKQDKSGIKSLNGQHSTEGAAVDVMTDYNHACVQDQETCDDATMVSCEEPLHPSFNEESEPHSSGSRSPDSVEDAPELKPLIPVVDACVAMEIVTQFVLDGEPEDPQPLYDCLHTESLSGTPGGRKLWTDEDMEKALDALRNTVMSLSKAAHVYGIPATTLWQRAHRMGIETPKKEGPNKTWSEHDLAGALEELRSGRMSANRASKEFGIPNSTLYKIARKEGIKLSSPFSAIQPSWNPDDLTKALDAIRGGMSVQKAAQEYGIPTGTLYGRCRREGIELSKYQGVPWSEEDMKDALEAVRVGEMSINQAAIHFNLPYSSLYGRFKRGKYEDGLPHQDFLHQEMTVEHYPADPQHTPQNQQQPLQQPQQQAQHTPPPPQQQAQQQQQQQLTPGPPSEQY